jgi:transglutaminase-like putative cysteine protease
MIYDVRHVTTYTYGSPVTFAQCTLRMLPSSGVGQTVLSRSLTVDPQPSSLAEHISFFGEHVAVAQIDTAHTELRIEARSCVRVQRRHVGLHDTGLPWDQVREHAFAIQSLQPSSPAHFIFASRLTPFWSEVTSYVTESFSPRRPIIEAARDLIRRIRREFKYDPDATRVSTPLIDAFRARHGVCQDYAHIMIAGLRGLGLPAAYVSGYIRTIPPQGQPRLEGGDASHAWVALWCGPDDGWIGFDPTNNIIENDDHVVLGWGRDYGDVAPLGGILQGTREQEVDVAVDVIPIGEAASLAGEPVADRY